MLSLDHWVKLRPSEVGFYQVNGQTVFPMVGDDSKPTGGAISLMYFPVNTDSK